MRFLTIQPFSHEKKHRQQLAFSQPEPMRSIPGTIQSTIGGWNTAKLLPQLLRRQKE